MENLRDLNDVEIYLYLRLRLVLSQLEVQNSCVLLLCLLKSLSTVLLPILKVVVSLQCQGTK